jgi:hypothetical protein
MSYDIFLNLEQAGNISLFRDNRNMLWPARCLWPHLQPGAHPRRSSKQGDFFRDPNDPNASLLAYKARPLNGIWATAPFLHNGSVIPTATRLRTHSRRAERVLTAGSLARVFTTPALRAPAL